MFDRPRRRSHKTKSEIPLWEPKVQEKIIDPLVDGWPEARKRLKSAFDAGKEKASDLYASVAQVITEKKEAWEDRLAEKKHQKKQAGKKANTGT